MALCLAVGNRPLHLVVFELMVRDERNHRVAWDHKEEMRPIWEILEKIISFFIREYDLYILSRKVKHYFFLRKLGFQDSLDTFQ